jgi:acetyl esterase
MDISDQPWVDPETIALGAELKRRGLVAARDVPVAEQRAAQDRLSAFLNEGSVPLAGERDVVIAGPGGPIPCRLYLPDGATAASPPPLLVYAHGGGFVIGRVAGWHATMRALVRASGVAALSVDYRLAPEHRFPAGFDDLIAVLRHVARDGATLGIDPARLAVGGDSAGANLALSAALALRDAGASPVRFLLLVYGVYSTDGESSSWQQLGDGRFGLTRDGIAKLWETYLAAPDQKRDWRAAPILAELAGLPPAHLLIGTLDPLLDDNRALAQRLAAAGVPHRLEIYEGLQHGFIRHGHLIKTAGRAVADCAAALRHALG